MPTLFTRVAGLAGLLTAGFAVVLVLMQAVDVVQVYRGRFSSVFGEEAWFAVSVLLLFANVLLVLGLAARTGTARTPWIAVVVVSLVAALGVGIYLWWALPVWGSLLSVGALAVAVSVHRRRVPLDGGAAWALWLLVLAWPAWAAVLFGLEPFGIGRVDVYGDHVLAFLAASLTATALLAPAAVRLGSWMAREGSAPRRPATPLART